MRPKKEKPVKPKEVPQEQPSGDGVDSDSQMTMPPQMIEKKPKEEKESAFLGGELPFIFDQNMMLDSILKINTINFAGNLMLSWGQIKLQL